MGTGTLPPISNSIEHAWAIVLQRPPVNLHLPAEQHWTQTKAIQLKVFLENPPRRCNLPSEGS